MSKNKAQKMNPAVAGKQLKKAKPVNASVIYAMIFVTLITIVTYSSSLFNGFVWDDDDYIRNNLLVQSFNIVDIFSSFTMGNYHPITMLSFAIENKLFGLSETGFHVVSLILHLLNVFLVFRLVFLLTEKFPAAFVASLLFGIHPMHVESVAWISERKDLLYTAFFLVAYIYYLNFRKENSRRSYFLSLLFFLLSLLSKAMAACFPFVLILTDYLLGRRIDRKSLVEKIPFFAMSIIFGIIAVMAQRGVGATDITVFPFSQRVVFACYGFIVYLYKLILPFQLGAFYAYPIAIGEFLPTIYYLFVIMFVVVITLVIYSGRYTRNIIFGIGFFTITILLVLQLLPVGSAIMADRYSYLPSIGIFYLAGIVFNELWKRKQSTHMNVPVIILLSVFVIFFSVKTYALCEIWKDGLTLWNSVISQNPYSPTAYSNRGIAYMSQNQTEEALKDFNKAIELMPNYADVLTNRGVLYIKMNKYEEALHDFEKSIKIDPTISSTYNNMGYVLLYLNRFDESLSSLNRAIELNPYNVDAYYNRGMTLKSMNRFEDAIKNFDKSIQLNSSYANAYFDRGICLMNLSRLDEAMRDFSTTISLVPEFAGAYEYRSNLYLNSKNYDAALGDINKLIELQPNSATAYLNRGSLNASMKKFAEAIADFNKAISIQPDLAKAYYNKAMIEFSADIKDSACIHLKQAADFGFAKAADLYKQTCK